MGKKALTRVQVSRIIYLRERGHSLPEIKRMTGHGYGTVFNYIRGVRILPQFQEFWRSKRRSSTFRALQQQKKAQEHAQQLIRKIDERNKIITAVSLYWAEGSKGDLSLTNTDPALIETFVECLKHLGVEKERFSISLRLYEDLDQGKARTFWAKVVGIPKTRITYVDVLKGRKRGKLKYGMCRVRVTRGAYFLKLLNALKDIMKNDICSRSLTERTGVS